MAATLRLWHTEIGGNLTSQENGFRLSVRPPKRDGGAIWFLVLRREGNDFAIAAGGTEGDVRAAMTAASFMAKVLSDAPSSPLRISSTRICSK